MVDALTPPERLVGSVLFPSVEPDRLPIIARLRAADVAVTQHPTSTRFPWGMDMRHPTLGDAQMVLNTELPLPDAAVFEQSLGITPNERVAALTCRSLVGLSVATAGEPVLRAMKRWLRWSQLVMGDDGLCAIDHRSHRVWSPAALAIELAHDAPLDVAALFAIHQVADEDGTVRWIHTHGLGALGGFDIDVLQPHDDVGQLAGISLFRALAYAILEGRLTLKTRRFHLLADAPVRPVPVRRFHARADARYQSLREQDEIHDAPRAVLCEPEPWWRIWARPEPAHVTQQPMEGTLLHFTEHAADIMAERARATWPWVRALVDRLGDAAELWVKIGIVIDGSDDEREHPWFKVHEHTANDVDATLMNEPFDIARLSAGVRGRWSVSGFSEWIVWTPVGVITPWHDLVARILDEPAQLPPD